jgi:hypothetical protein
MDATKLQTALIEAGMAEITFNITDAETTVDVLDVTDKGLIALLRYGTRKANDTVNGAISRLKKEEKPIDKDAIVTECLAHILSGETAQRARISPIEAELRSIVKAKLQSIGLKATDAGKLAKDAKAGFSEYLRQYIATAKEIKAVEVEDSTIEAAFAKNWPNIEARANEIIEQKSLKLEIDLD